MHLLAQAPASPRYNEATETHNVVIATLVLAVVTMLAIVVPLLAAARDRWRRSRGAVVELDAISRVVEVQLATLADNPHALVSGAAIDLIAGRAFSTESVGALSPEKLALVYEALAQACDVIVACRQLPPIRSSSQDPDSVFTAAVAHLDARQVKAQAELALARLRDARNLLVNALR